MNGIVINTTRFEYSETPTVEINWTGRFSGLNMSGNSTVTIEEFMAAAVNGVQGFNDLIKEDIIAKMNEPIEEPTPPAE